MVLKFARLEQKLEPSRWCRCIGKVNNIGYCIGHIESLYGIVPIGKICEIASEVWICPCARCNRRRKEMFISPLAAATSFRPRNQFTLADRNQISNSTLTSNSVEPLEGCSHFSNSTFMSSSGPPFPEYLLVPSRSVAGWRYSVMLS